MRTIDSALHASGRRAWYAFGLWLRVVVVGAGMLATGVALLLERNTALTPVVAWLIGGGALAAFAWSRAGAALRRVDSAEGTAKQTSSTDNPRAAHRAASAAPVPHFGLSVDATGLE